VAPSLPVLSYVTNPSAVGALLLGAALTLPACAGTRVASVGPLPNDEPLVTLVVSEDRHVVRSECPDILWLGVPAGCHIPRRLEAPDGRQIVAVKIVRYTDSLPSAMAFEIEAHELCHAVAALQNLPDPCHTGNAGFLQTSHGAQLRFR